MVEPVAQDYPGAYGGDTDAQYSSLLGQANDTVGGPPGVVYLPNLKSDGSSEAGDLYNTTAGAAMNAGGPWVNDDGLPLNGSGGAGADASGSQPAKFSRSKGACQQCRAVKQRCSGGSAGKWPCERCQLYRLECVFSKEPPPRNDQPKAPRKVQPKTSTPSDPETSAAVLQSLRVITEKLRTIEETLALQQRSGFSHPQQHFNDGFDHDVRIPTYENMSGEDGMGDPISMVTSAIKGLDEIMSTNSPYSASSTGQSGTGSPRLGSSQGRIPGAKNMSTEPDIPDAISQGIITVEEAQQLFDFYFSRCADWTPPLDVLNDKNMHHVRRRSIFLFHAILSVASYFCFVPQGEVGLRKYYAIVTTLVKSLAPMVVSPHPAELTVDLLMGLLICIVWKPVRCGSQMQLGAAGFGQLQAQSKLNPSSGYVLGGLALRISQLLSLGKRASHPTPSNKASVQACRLWLFINLVDSQGALAEGKRPALDPADALRVTRLFASLKTKPGDVRLAAMVELYAAVIPIVAMHHGGRKTDFRSLYRANAVIDRIAAYWEPLMEEAHSSGDPLACTFINCFVPFVRVVLNSDVLRTWLIRMKTEGNGHIDLDNSRHSLTPEEAHCLGFAVSAAEEMLYSLSTAAKSATARRNSTWANRDPTTGHRPSLQLDPDIASKLSSAVDSVLLVIYAFPPLFLAQMRAQNIINCDLDMAPEITNDLYSVGFPSRALLPASKFMRLLELTAEFYEVVSPNKDFPAIPQAQLLRSMACLSIPDGVPLPNSNFQQGDPSGMSCMLPGGLNNLSNTSAKAYFETSAPAKAHQFQMQQIATNLQPTNSNLPFPYNTMVFSTEGADRLDHIMQNAVPDPVTAPSLLGSFARIDADWNTYFKAPASLTTYENGLNDFGGIGGLSGTPISSSSFMGMQNGIVRGRPQDSNPTLTHPGMHSTASYYSQQPLQQVMQSRRA